MSAVSFGKAAFGGPLQRRDGAYSIEDALWEIIHNEKEIGLRVFTNTLEPRLYGRSTFLSELQMMLATKGSFLEVYTPAGVLAGYNENHPFLAFIRERQDRRPNVFVKEVDVLPPLENDFFQGSLGQTFVGLNEHMGYFFCDDQQHYKNVEKMFAIYRGQTDTGASLKPAVPEAFR
jgi:hypothetical protein